MTTVFIVPAIEAGRHQLCESFYSVVEPNGEDGGLEEVPGTWTAKEVRET